MSHPDAERCLGCKRARCSLACPVHTDVPTAIRLYKEGRVDEAARMLFINNPLSAITSQVCDWKKLCFGHCVLNARKVPIHWYEIEQEISCHYLEISAVSPGKALGKKVSIVGGGPAGITAAVILRSRGLDVTVYDDHSRLGGVLRYGIPSFRLDKKWVDQYERIFSEAGIVFKGDVKVGENVKIDGLLCESDAVLIAGGAWKPRRLDVPGEDTEGVIYALDYLNDPSAYSIGRKVLVVGGGNVTMDAARTARRQDSDVTVVYRKTFENMPANVSEVEETLKEGVDFQLFQVPVAIRSEGGKKVAVVRNCENYVDENGVVRTRILEGTDHDMPFDSLIVAISENVDYSLLGDLSLDTERWGRPVVDTGEMTSRKGLFIAGDFATGPKTVVEAVASAKVAVEGICSYLGVTSDTNMETL